MLNIVNIKIWLWIMNTIVIDNNMIIATRCLQTVKSHSRIATGKDGQNGSSRGISGLERCICPGFHVAFQTAA